MTDQRRTMPWGVLAVGVIARSPVGIDVESVSRDATKVMERVCSPAERTFLEKKYSILGNLVPAPVILWSGKEAFSKAVGLGMKFGLAHFEIDLSSLKNEIASAKTDLVGPLSVENSAIAYHVHNNFLISVCSSRPEFSSGIEWRILGGDLRG